MNARAVFVAVLTLALAVPVMASPLGWSLLPQTPPPQQAPPQTPPAAKPAEPATSAKPFPADARIAVINLQLVAAESAEGKASSAKLQALNQQKVNELNEKNKALQAAQAKLKAETLSAEARAQIAKEIDRLNVEIQRFTQDAQAEVEELQRELQALFERKLMPIIELVAVDKNLQVIFSHDGGLAWFDSAIDITAEVIRRFDAAMGRVQKAPDLPLDSRTSVDLPSR